MKTLTKICFASNFVTNNNYLRTFSRNKLGY